MLLGLGYATMIQSFSWNQTSHYDLIRALNRTDDDRRLPEQHRRQGALPRPLLLGAGPRTGAVLTALLRHAERRQRPHWARSSPASAQRRRDRLAHRAVGQRAAGDGAGSAGLADGRALRARLRRVGRDRPRSGHAGPAAVDAAVLHMFTAFLAFAAFALMVRERDGPPSGVAARRSPACSWATRSRRSTRSPSSARCSASICCRGATRCTRSARAAPGRSLCGRRVVGILPLLLYNHYAFHSWTHLAYSDVPRQHAGFFGIGAPSLRVLATLLFDSRGLLTLSPVLVMGAVGHGAALPARPARRGADDRRDLRAATWSTTRATTCPSAAASCGRAS